MAEPVPVPANLQPYVELLGQELAIRFFLEFGGAELYLAARPQARGRLARVVGEEKAAALAEAGDRLQRRVPLAKRWIAHVLKRERGLSVAEIARRLHASDVSVRGWLKSPPTGQLTGQQLPLL